jgi:hypothetical protein
MTDVPPPPPPGPPSISNVPTSGLSTGTSPSTPSSTAPSLSLADQLAARRTKLTKTVDTKIHDGPKVNGYVSTEEVKAYYNDVLDINLESWIHLISDHTFPTEMVPFTIDDAKALIATYKDMKRSNAQTLSPTQRLRLVYPIKGILVNNTHSVSMK